MYIDEERRADLEREKGAAVTEIERLQAVGGKAAEASIRALAERIRAIDETLNRMEFATEIERQSDA
jgi:hypothetical protein